MQDIVNKINNGLKKMGADRAEGTFKMYEANSRSHLFLKAENLPGQPVIDISVDLPGDLDKAVMGGANALMNATGLGNAPEDSQPSN